MWFLLYNKLLVEEKRFPNKHIAHSQTSLQFMEENGYKTTFPETLEKKKLTFRINILKYFC